jgi:hypothetical protein
MNGMEERPDAQGVLPVVQLSSAGQTYVAMVGSLALVSTLSDGRAWYVALVLFTLPLTPVALWVGFYAALAVGAVAGHGPDAWSVTLVWVAVWTMTAWLNARVVEKVLRLGWAGRWLPMPDER